MKTISKVIALNGFMGTPKDWEMIDLGVKIDPWISKKPLNNLEQLALELNDYAAEYKEKPFLLGYSLGGRIALHALIANPDAWSGAIIVSAHPGLQTGDEKAKRLKEDQLWAEMIRNMSWDNFLEAWNGRGAFSGGRFAFERKETDYCRLKLADQLLASSLATQKDLRKEIAKLPLPILWMVGEKDKTYCSLSESLSFQHTLSKVVKISNAGHRLLWEQPELCKTLIIDFCRY